MKKRIKVFKLKKIAGRFSMVELVLALVIVVIGIIGLIGLLPLSMESDKSSMGTSNASDAAEQFLHFNASQIKRDWNWINAFPKVKSAGDDTGIVWSSTSLIISDNLNIKYAVTDPVEEFDPAVHQTGFFLLNQLTGGKVDFSAVCRVWKHVEEPAGNAKSVKLHVELSFPAEKPYNSRDKVNFSLDVYRQAELTFNTMATFLCQTLWAVDGGDDGKLYYHTLSENNDVNLEGELNGVSGPINVEALTIDPNGKIYFMNNGSTSKLYMVGPEYVDKKPDTSVTVKYVGDTGLGGSSKITNLQFFENNLYGIGNSNGKIYQVNTDSAAVNQVSSLSQSGFQTDGLTSGTDGKIYLSKTLTSESELWRFSNFPNGAIELVTVIEGSGKILGLAAHPNGQIYALDSDRWYRIDPVHMTVDVEAEYESEIEDFDFYFNSPSEGGGCGDIVVFCDHEHGDVLTNINPGNSAKNEFCLEKPDGTRITRDELKDQTVITYDGPATRIFLKPIGNANNNAITINNETYPLPNGTTYTITGTITAYLFNDHPNHPDNLAMGHWMINIAGPDLIVEPNSDNPCE